MSTSNNQPKDLYAINTVQDLSQESAAAVQGGSLEAFEHINYGGKSIAIDMSLPYLIAFNDTISSVANYTNSYWGLYTNADFTGSCLVIAPWQEKSWVGTKYNDQISSIARG